MVISNFLVLGHKRPFLVWSQTSGSQTSWSQKGCNKSPGHKRPGHKGLGHKRPGHKRPPTRYNMLVYYCSYPGAGATS